MEEHKVDTELVEVIESAISSSKNYLEAFDKVMKFKKEKRGLRGFHASPSLDIMCGTRKVENPEEEAEKMAHDILIMDLECAKGHYKDVTNEIL